MNIKLIILKTIGRFIITVGAIAIAFVLSFHPLDQSEKTSLVLWFILVIIGIILEVWGEYQNSAKIKKK